MEVHNVCKTEQATTEKTKEKTIKDAIKIKAIKRNYKYQDRSLGKQALEKKEQNRGTKCRQKGQ